MSGHDVSSGISPRLIACTLFAAAASLPVPAQDGGRGSADRQFRESFQPVRLEDADDLDDLEFLRPLLRDKRVVLLGEANHGSREIFLVKNRLIRFLHRELGFRVLLLESGIGEVHSIDLRRGELSVQEMLAGLIGPWRSREFAELMSYLEQAPTLRVGGYDVQRSGRSFGELVGGVLRDLDGAGSDRYRDIEQRFTDLQPRLTDRQREFDEATASAVDSLRADYLALSRMITDNAAALTGTTWTAEQVAILAATLDNRVAYLDYFAQFRRDGDFRRRWEARDRALARNVLLFANQLFPDEKLIVSGHNFHVARYNATEQVMGEMLAESFGDAMYSIGIFPGSGTFADNSRRPERLGEPAEDHDLQRIIGRIGLPAAFLDVPDRPSAGTEWLFAEVIANHTFLDLSGRNTLVPARSFDGLLLIAEVSMARY